MRFDRYFIISSMFLGAILLLFLASCSKLGRASVTHRLRPCGASEGPTDAYCGTYEVWEDRQVRSGRRIALKIVVLPALKQSYAPDPLFVLAGGPGESATDAAKAAGVLFHSIQVGRDVVLVDRRGTGKSNPLDCKSISENTEQSDPVGAAVDRLRVCLSECQKRADVTKYTTDIAMDDLDEVRQFLGYAKINLYGVSYGTRAAMVYARRHPEQTRALILDSVAPTNFRLPLYIARDSQRALDLLIQDCANDRQCNARFPKLRQRIEQLLARLSANPQRVHNRDPRTGLVKEVEVNRLTIAVALFESLESSTHSALVPLLVEQAENGDFSGFLALSETFRQASSGVAQGLYYSVVCSEDAPQIEPGAIERESAGTFLSAEFAEQRLKPCGFWPRAKLDPEYFLNSSMDVPALILSGEIDPLTPPTWGAEVAARWKNSRHVVVPGSGHRAIASGGVIKLIAQFLESGNASALDLSVLQRLHRPPFFLGPSGPCLSAEVAR